VYISRVLQESRIDVDENGVAAAAYTLVALAKGAAIPVEREKVDFHLDRPFLYAIESWDGTVLFLGAVTEPVQN
jgi:serpin B